MDNWPAQLEVPRIEGFDTSLRLPGSKSVTNRAMVLGALAEGETELSGALVSQDTQRMVEALAALGFELEAADQGRHVRIRGQGGRIPANGAKLNTGNAGTVMRPLIAACCLGRGTFELDGIERMRQRPVGELVEPLRAIGGRVNYLNQIGYPPVQVVGEGGLAGGRVEMRPTLSSQFITALLMVGPYCRDGLTVHFEGEVTSRPYVEMTLRLMHHFGAQVEVANDFSRLRVEPGGYHALKFDIEPDASNASYFLAAAAILPGSRCTIEGLGAGSVQGDVGFAHVLGRMGAVVEIDEQSVTVRGPEQGLRGIDVDMNRMPDMAQTLAAVAVFADGPTCIRNVGNLRVKETDRMAAMQKELGRIGVRALIRGDDLCVEPAGDSGIKPAVIETYDDHRMAMSFAVIGLRAGGITINDPGCVSKTFPTFFDQLQELTRQTGAKG